MSSTNRGAERRLDDVYETPAWCVHRLLDTGALTDWMAPSAVWLEPAAGSGAIIRAVRRWFAERRRGDGPRWFATDIRDTSETLPWVYGFRCADFLALPASTWDGPTVLDERPPPCLVDGIITNPPFSLAEEFVKASLAATVGPVAMLLRLGWLASAKRAPLMHRTPPDVYVLPDRPSFTGTGTDSADYCWAVWLPSDEPRERERGTFRVLATTPVDERRVKPTAQTDLPLART